MVSLVIFLFAKINIVSDKTAHIELFTPVRIYEEINIQAFTFILHSYFNNENVMNYIRGLTISSNSHFMRSIFICICRFNVRLIQMHEFRLNYSKMELSSVVAALKFNSMKLNTASSFMQKRFGPFLWLIFSILRNVSSAHGVPVKKKSLNQTESSLDIWVVCLG